MKLSYLAKLVSVAINKCKHLDETTLVSKPIFDVFRFLEKLFSLCYEDFIFFIEFSTFTP